MTTFGQKFNTILLEWLKEREEKATQILGWEDYTYYGGYCETCSYEEQQILIRYLDDRNARQEYYYEGTFTELLEGLLAVELVE